MGAGLREVGAKKMKMKTTLLKEIKMRRRKKQKFPQVTWLLQYPILKL